MQMQPMMAAYYPNNVTTDHIQQVLSSTSPLYLFAFSWLSYLPPLWRMPHLFVSWSGESLLLCLSKSFWGLFSVWFLFLSNWLWTFFVRYPSCCFIICSNWFLFVLLAWGFLTFFEKFWWELWLYFAFLSWFPGTSIWSLNECGNGKWVAVASFVPLPSTFVFLKSWMILPNIFFWGRGPGGRQRFITFGVTYSQLILSHEELDLYITYCSLRVL